MLSALLLLLAADPVQRVGAGGYTTALPAGARRPQEAIYQTENVRGKMPTNDWWSSLAWMKFSERHYPHPLAVEAEPGGLRVYYPQRITATPAAIFGFMPARNGEDVLLGHSACDAFPDARVDDFSDWFVAARFATDRQSLRVCYGHGSPFVYALYQGGGARLRFARPIKVWSGDGRSPALGVSVEGKHYGLFGPAGSTWTGLDGRTLTNHPDGKAHFTLALLPDASEKTLARFRAAAHRHIVGSTVAWRYDEKTSRVETTFTVRLKTYEGGPGETLFALYPHQWRTAAGLKYLGEYASVRGTMKLAAGCSFTTTMVYPGVLPALPDVGGADKKLLETCLRDEARRPPPPVADTYADGKWLGRIAALVPLAEQIGARDSADALRDRLRQRLEEWLGGGPKARGRFFYDARWGTLIGYPASFGSDVELNDHHFHYGYFVKAAAELARHDPALAKQERWGGMVRLLIRDMASPDRDDRLFPFLRNFDPYAGHSWASGHARFGDGNNNESSSEAMNAWAGLILWGEATGDRTVRDLGVYLYTTEMHAIQEYWFDVHGDTFPKGYTPSVVTMVWGGKGANATWFSARPEHIHGINWLPIHAGSLYLARYPAYLEKNYQALVRENGGTAWQSWADLIWMVRALLDPADALRQYTAAGEKATFEAGNTRAATYAWLHRLAALGRVDPTVTADAPLYAVFRDGTGRTYVAYHSGDGERTVTFSDGFRLKVQGRTLTHARSAR